MNKFKPSLQFGFLLPAAIFILVILASLGAYAINLSVTSNATATQDIQSARAYHMARAGVEWAAYQVMLPGTANLGNCPANPSRLALDGFQITVRCTRSADYLEQGGNHIIAVYDIESTARFGTARTQSYIERQLQVKLTKCRGIDAALPYQCN